MTLLAAIFALYGATCAAMPAGGTAHPLAKLQLQTTTSTAPSVCPAFGSVTFLTPARFEFILPISMSEFGNMPAAAGWLERYHIRSGLSPPLGGSGRLD